MIAERRICRWIKACEHDTELLQVGVLQREQLAHENEERCGRIQACGHDREVLQVEVLAGPEASARVCDE